MVGFRGISKIAKRGRLVQQPGVNRELSDLLRPRQKVDFEIILFHQLLDY